MWTPPQPPEWTDGKPITKMPPPGMNQPTGSNRTSIAGGWSPCWPGALGKVPASPGTQRLSHLPGAANPSVTQGLGSRPPRPLCHLVYMPLLLLLFHLRHGAGVLSVLNRSNYPKMHFAISPTQHRLHSSVGAQLCRKVPVPASQLSLSPTNTAQQMKVILRSTVYK